MSSFRTGVQDLISDSDGTNGIYNPMTPALNSTRFKTVRCRLLTYGTGGVQVQPYVEYSDDGVNWSSGDRDVLDSLVTPTDGTLYTPSGWSSTDIYGAGFSPKPFVRFGLYSKSTTSGDPRAFQAALEVTGVERVAWATIPFERQLVFTSGAADHTFAITPLLDAAEFDEARASVELESEAEMSGSLGFRVDCREVNKPKDPSDFTHLEYVPSGTYQTSTLVGTTFTALTPLKRYVQFFGQVTRSGGTSGDLVMGRIRTRIDLRKV